LIVDDGPEMRELLAMICLHSGYDAITAGTGEEGIQAAVLNGPAAILLDFVLPGMRGSEVLRHLREHPATGQIPVILVTGHAKRSVAEWSSSASAIISKPFTIEELQQALVRVIGGRPDS
jgi:CheY-like chemotaxis protein